MDQIDQTPIRILAGAGRLATESWEDDDEEEEAGGRRGNGSRGSRQRGCGWVIALETGRLLSYSAWTKDNFQRALSGDQLRRAEGTDSCYKLLRVTPET